MNPLEEIEKQRTLQGVSWEKLAENLPIGGNALRIAFKRKNVKDLYLKEIEKVLGIETDESSTNHQPFESPSLAKEGVDVSLDEIACFAEDNHKVFFEHNYFKKEIELRVAKKLVALASDPEKFKEFLK